MVAAQPGRSANPMTRNAWVTVRLPGARTAPETSTRMRFQTGAVKHGRKMASQETSISGVWETTETKFGASVFHQVLESRRPGRAESSGCAGRRTQPFATPLIGFRSLEPQWLTRSFNKSEQFRCSRRALFAERRNSG